MVVMEDIAVMEVMVVMEVAEGRLNLAAIRVIKVIASMEVMEEVGVQNQDSLGPEDPLAISLGEIKSLHCI